MEDIVFGRGIVTRSHLLKYINNRKYIIIADSEVYARYPEIFDGLQVFCAPSGEEAKSFETYIEMVTACNIAYLTRGGVVVAVGGGAVLDAAGFLASTYKRGVSLIKVPTTVIAMCDAAIGGKNAINSHSAKNEIGTFYSAEIILGDIDFLHTLPDEEIRAGLGEMIKYAIGFAPEMLETLQDLKFDDMDSLLGLIRRAAELKQKIVEADFRESGDRKLLNFGHTLAHAIEFATDFKVSHGSAVAVGVYYMSRWAHREGRLQEADMDLIDRCYNHLNLPQELPRNCNKNVVFSHVLSDKKMVGDDIDLVKLYELGSLEIVRTSLDAFYDGIFKDSFSNRGLRGSGTASSVNAVKEAGQAAPAVIDLPVSKSYAHRFFILAAFADFPTVIEKFELSEDIRHTVEALKLMSGARFEFGESEFAVVPRRYVEKDAEREEPAMYTRRTGRIEIDCGSSASTARFLIPFSNIRTEFDGVTYFYGSPSLENRPMNSIIHVLKAQNLLSGEVHTGSLPFGVKGRFKPGIYRIPGNITSQFLSGLLMAAPMMNGRSRIIVSGKQVSLPYVNITIDAMRHMGVEVEADVEKGLYHISPGHYAAKGKIRVEKDYSQAAFWIVAELLRQLNGGDFRQILLPGMNPHSLQGDRVILDILGIRIEPSGRITRVREPRSQADLTHCPDLFPILSVFYALYEKGGTITGADRVSYKESDRYEAMRLELTKLGCRAVREGGKFRIYPGRLKGNICSAHDDHRVAMALLILSLFVDNVRLDSSECIGKSYPMFLEDLKKVMEMNNKKQ